MKTWPDWGTLDLSLSRVLLPPMKTWPGWGTLDLSLSREPIPQWKLGQVEGFWIWVGLEYPPHNDLCETWYVETNRCIPKGKVTVSLELLGCRFLNFVQVMCTWIILMINLKSILKCLVAGGFLLCCDYKNQNGVSRQFHNNQAFPSIIQ